MHATTRVIAHPSHQRTITTRLLFWSMFLAFVFTAAPGGLSAQEVDTTATDSTMSINFKDTDIRDVIRTISKAYNLNIIIDKDVSGKVTFNLSNVPIMEGLRTIAESQGLEVVRDGSVYRIKQAGEQQRKTISYFDGKLTVDVQNVDAREFLRELSAKAAISVVPDGKVEGTVSGRLYRVELDHGIRALLEGNGFSVRRIRNIYQVSMDDESSSPPSGLASRRSRRSSGGNNAFYVDYRDGILSLEASNEPLDNVIKAIAEQSEMQIITYEQLRGDVNARLEEVPLDEALALLLGGTQFTFIRKDNIFLIGNRNPATPSGEALSTSELIPLRHIKAEGVPGVLPKYIQPQNVKVVKEQNALLVSGTSEDIVNTKSFLQTIDIPTPQVVIDVLVVEYSRDIERNFGIEAGTASSTYAPNFSYPYLEGGGIIKGLQEIFDDVKGVALVDNFYVQLKALEKQDKAKVLAQPSLTVLNGHKATIDVGQTQFYRIVSGTDENRTYQFRPISFGIQLNITPWISQGGQITAEISPEISNAMGVNSEGYPNVFKRSVTTTVRLDHNRTLVLGGLLRGEDQETQNKVPILGDLPILGALFRTSLKKKIQTNLVIYITPRLVERAGVDLTSELEKFEDSQSIRSWGEESFTETLKRSPTTPRSMIKDSLDLLRADSLEGYIEVPGYKSDSLINSDSLFMDLGKDPQGLGAPDTAGSTESRMTSTERPTRRRPSAGRNLDDIVPSSEEPAPPENSVFDTRPDGMFDRRNRATSTARIGAPPERDDD